MSIVCEKQNTVLINSSNNNMGKNKHNGTEYQQISMAKQGLKTFDIKLTD